MNLRRTATIASLVMLPPIILATLAGCEGPRPELAAGTGLDVPARLDDSAMFDDGGPLTIDGAGPSSWADDSTEQSEAAITESLVPDDSYGAGLETSDDLSGDSALETGSVGGEINQTDPFDTMEGGVADLPVPAGGVRGEGDDAELDVAPEPAEPSTTPPARSAAPTSPPTTAPAAPSPSLRAVTLPTTCGALHVQLPDAAGWRNLSWLGGGDRQMNIAGLGWNPADSLGVLVGGEPIVVSVSCNGQPPLERAETYVVTICGALRVSDGASSRVRRVSWAVDRWSGASIDAGSGWSDATSVDVAGGRPFGLAVRCGPVQVASVR